MKAHCLKALFKQCLEGNKRHQMSLLEHALSQSEVVAQLVEGLPSIIEALGVIPNTI